MAKQSRRDFLKNAVAGAAALAAGTTAKGSSEYNSRGKQPYVSQNDLIASICRESFYHFVLEFWEVINQEPLVDNWHIKYLCDIAQRAMERVFLGLPRESDIIVNVPPGSTKSTIFSIMLPAWAWTRMPHCRFLCASHTDTLVIDLSLKCRDIILSEKYQACFPEIKLRRDQNNKGHFKNTAGGMRFCCTVGGRTPTGMHSHVFTVDDPIDPKRSEDEPARIKANHFMTAVVPSRRVNKRVSVTMLIMQRLHEDDPTGHLLAKKKLKYAHYCLPATLTDDIQPRGLRAYYTRQGGYLDPNRLPQDVLDEALEVMGEYAYAGQYGQTPIPPGGGLFKIDKKGNLRLVNEPLPDREFDLLVRYWDKAATEDGGCRTAGVKIGRRKVGMTPGIKETKGHPAVDPRPIYEYWVLDVVAGQWGTDEREEAIRRTAELDGRHVVIGLEREGGSGGIHSAEWTVSNLAGWHVEVDVVAGKGSKLERARPFSSQLNIARVVIVNGPWAQAYIGELRYFPKGKFKDQVDASSGAFSRLSVGFIEVGALGRG